MPPESSPQPRLLLHRMARRCDETVESLIEAMPLAGDHDTQQSLDDALDAVMDALRMVAATGREVAEALPRSAEAVPAGAGGSGQRHTDQARSRAW